MRSNLNRIQYAKSQPYRKHWENQYKKSIEQTRLEYDSSLSLGFFTDWFYKECWIQDWNKVSPQKKFEDFPVFWRFLEIADDNSELEDN